MNTMMHKTISDKEAAKMASKKPPITVADLFCGMGGWSTGFKMFNQGSGTPFDVRWGLDEWENACAVHQDNHPEVSLVVNEIRDFAPHQFAPIDVIVGSPPCPAFSAAKQAQDQDKEKGFELINAFFRFVKELKPKAWAMENVIRLKKFVNRKYIPNLPDDFKTFTVWGPDYGLPQRRRRCIVTNIDVPGVANPPPTLGEMIDCLGLPGEEPPNLVMNPLHEPDMVPGEYADRHDLYEVNEEHITPLFTKKMMMEGAGFVEFPDPLEKPARTICAKPSPIGREPVVVLDRRFKPAKLRYLSLREQAMIQGFPADYKLTDEAKTHTQVMIGNAFPPPIVKGLAYEIWKKVRNYG